MGNDPHNCHGRGIIAVLHGSCDTVREEMAIVDIRVVFFSVGLLLFSLHAHESSL